MLVYVHAELLAILSQEINAMEDVKKQNMDYWQLPKMVQFFIVRNVKDGTYRRRQQQIFSNAYRRCLTGIVGKPLRCILNN